MQHLSDEFFGDLSALQRIQSVCKKGRYVLTNVNEAVKPVALGLLAILETFVLSGALSAWSNIFKVEKKVMKRDIDKIKTGLYSWRDSEPDDTFAELPQLQDSDIRALNKKRHDRDGSF